MNLHEYQAKEILSKYKIPFPPFEVVSSPKEVDAALERLHAEQVVLKVQVHAGGRGKAGGIKLLRTKVGAKEQVAKLLGLQFINNQTGPEGVIVEKVLISPLSHFKKEFYLAATIDRKLGQAVLIVSAKGGVDIEEVACHFPEAIFKCPIPYKSKMHSFQLWNIAQFMGWDKTVREEGMDLIQGLAQAFWELDASLLEINPLVLQDDNTFQALDAKLIIDDNALFRHKDLAGLYDRAQVPALEAKALQWDLSYIALEGNIGCMVNGAGLAMATMDIIEFYGGKPANFLDVGGGASQEKIAEGLKIILEDPKVKAIFINIFGGIMNCETLAAGILSAWEKEVIRVPVIVRMEGTRVQEAKEVFKRAKLNIQVGTTLADSAQKVVQAARSYTQTSSKIGFMALKKTRD